MSSSALAASVSVKPVPARADPAGLQHALVPPAPPARRGHCAPRSGEGVEHGVIELIGQEAFGVAVLGAMMLKGPACVVAIPVSASDGDPVGNGGEPSRWEGDRRGFRNFSNAHGWRLGVITRIG